VLKETPTTEPPPVIYPTIDQRISAAGKLADKLVPPVKSRAITLPLPQIKTAGDVLAALSEVLAAMGRGEITIDEAQQLATVFELKRKAVETAEIEARLAALEATQGKK